MANLIYYRIAGSAAAFSLHAVNSVIMLTALQDEILLKDPQIKNMATMKSCYLTIWNVVLQILYAGLALSCDVLTVLNKDHLLPKPIKKLRNGLFSSIVFPVTLLVFSVFWPLFIYDRSLIFPEYIDKAFSFKSNCVIHLAIIPYVLWELAFQPRTEPKSHALNITIMMAYYGVYCTHVHLVYNERGLWPYPILYQIYGTIFYILGHLFLIGLIINLYYIQWSLYTLIWGKDEKKKEKSK